MQADSWKPDHLLEQIDHDLGLAAELIRIFLEESPSILADMEHAIERRDAGGLASAAHAIKGSAAAIGAFATSEAAARLERAGRQGQVEAARSDLGDFTAGLGRLELCLQDTLAGELA